MPIKKLILCSSKFEKRWGTNGCLGFGHTNESWRIGSYSLNFCIMPLDHYWIHEPVSLDPPVIWWIFDSLLIRKTHLRIFNLIQASFDAFYLQLFFTFLSRFDTNYSSSMRNGPVCLVSHSILEQTTLTLNSWTIAFLRFSFFGGFSRSNQRYSMNTWAYLEGLIALNMFWSSRQRNTLWFGGSSTMLKNSQQESFWDCGVVEALGIM